MSIVHGHAAWTGEHALSLVQSASPPHLLTARSLTPVRTSPPDPSQSTPAIEALVVDDDVPELERFFLLLERGQAVQQLAAMQALPELLRDHGAAACMPLITLLADLVPGVVQRTAAGTSGDDGGLAIGAAHAFSQLLGAAGGSLEATLPLSALETCILPAVLAAVKLAPLVPIAHDDPISRLGAEWLDVLLRVLRTGRLSAATLERDVLPWALECGEVSSALGERLLCTHVLGGLAEGRADAAWIERHFLSAALAMCQDTELAVRSSMCGQLPLLAAALGPARTGAGLLTELLELTTDEHPEVRACAFECGISVLGHCDDARRASHLEPALHRTAHQCLLTLEAWEVDASPPGDAAPAEVVERVPQRCPSSSAPSRAPTPHPTASCPAAAARWRLRTALVCALARGGD